MAEGDFNVKAIISAETNKFESGMKKAQTSANNLSNTFGNLSNIIKNTLSIVGVGAGIKAFVDFGKASIQAAESANKSLNILNNTLKVTGATAWTTSEEMVEMSKKIAGSTNYTVGEIQDMQSVLLGFKNITEETFEDASVAITDMATVMGMDLKSAVQTVGKALDDPIKGLDSLKRQGFAFTDEQKDLMKTLVESGKILEAQNMILEELNTTYGGAAVAAQSGFDKQKDAVIEFKETVGNQLLPIMERWSSESATTFEKLTEGIQKIDFTSIAANLEYAVDVVKEFALMIYENIKELFSELQNVFDDGANIVDIWKESLWDSFNNVYRIIQDVFGLITALIKGDWEVAWSYAKLTVLRVVDAILDNLSKLLNAFPKVVNGFIAGINEIIKGMNYVKEFFGGESIDLLKPFESVDLSAITGVQKKIEETEKEIEEATGKAADHAIKDMDKVSERRKKYVKETKSDGLKLRDSSEATTKAMSKGWTKYYEDLKKKAEDWSETIGSVFDTFTDTISTMFNQAAEDLLDGEASWEDYASAAVKGIAEVLSALGKQLMVMAVVKAVSHDYAAAAVAMTGAMVALGASALLTSVSNKIGQVSERVGEMTDKLKQAKISLEELKKEFESINESFTQTTSTYMSTFTNLSNSIATAQHNFSEAFVSMIETSSQLQTVGEELNYYQQMALNISPGSMLGPYGPYTYEQVLHMEELSHEIENLENELTGWQEVMQGNMQTMIEEMTKLNSLLDEIVDNYKAQIATIDDLVQSYNYFYGVIASGNASLKEYNVIFYEQLLNVKKLVSEVYTSLTQAGQDIGSTLVSSIIDGASKEDFLRQMKDYIRQNLLKLAVYTESFQNRLAEVGTKIATALTTGGSVSELRTELELLWNEASTQAQAVEQVISSVFGDLEEIVEETVEVVEESIEVVEEKISRLQQMINNFNETVSDLGGEIASELINGIVEGLDETNFMDSIKQWLRKMIVQSVVYTESMKSKLERIGKIISDGVVGGFTQSTLEGVKNELKNIFNEIGDSMNTIDDVLNSVFGSVFETVEENIQQSVNVVEEEISRFEQAVNSFKDAVSDLGGDLASNLIDGLTNGLGQSDFLDNIKSWIKKMLVQTLVYTESMKAEIEAIGAAITKGLSEGFTETTFHEIRRDLSWVFDQANKTIEGIDDILNSVFGTGYATGTNNATKGLHLVGEAGPELVRFRGGEQVINAGNTQKALQGMGGTVVNQNVTFNNLQDTTAFAMLQQFKQYNRQMAINGVL